MGLADETNDAILDLWYRPEHRLLDRQPRMPRVYPPFKDRGILVVGHNPSFSDRAFSKFLTEVEWADFDPHDFYAWKETAKEFDLARACRIEQLAIQRYEHYAPFAALAQKLGTHWNYVDLFLLRETKDKLVRPQVCKGGAHGWGLDVLNGFGRAQVDLCVALVAQLKPELMIVANAAASHILRQALDASFDASASAGYHTAVIAAQRTPIFFSSMWTGQRALDVFSRERMHWQIERTYKERSDLHGGEKPG